ncbi:hypothetical protein BJX61DRAFT_502109 [Aspergillus egyptiacus]|nr:hypothetical protein BJX61DRAFT_502109 [Aspergillus egyptiacus]
MAWIYLIDTHVVIFSRLPPQFRISEAQFGLPQQDAVFNAVDPTRLDLRAPQPTRQSQTWTLQIAVQQLMSDQLAGLDEMRPHIDTFFAHFLLIGGRSFAPFETDEIHILNRSQPCILYSSTSKRCKAAATFAGQLCPSSGR